MYSFYGGRPGNSFIIITTYRSIADMVAKFRQGPNYTAVHYDEHVMINTVNKNDPDNGKIYRRGYEFTNDMGGAEFIGTIVGPSGRAPMLELTTVADVKTKKAKEGYDERKGSGSYAVSGGNLVPGKKNDGTFNDAITWQYCSIRNENDEDSTAYIGFAFPYTVIDYETSAVDPYISGRYADTSSATRVDDEKHPFFEKWHINIPKGVKGNALMNLKVEAASANVQDYTGRADDISNNRAILAYDYYNYDDYQNGKPVRLYLGDYNVIDNVSIADDGTITIGYTHDDDAVWTKKLKWVQSATLNPDNGLFTLTYNHTTDAEGNPTTYSTYLDWVKTVSIDEDGTVTFDHSHEDDTVYDKLIKWCTGVTINNNGTVTFTWNNGSSDTIFSNIIQWISSVNLAADGTLTVGYNNGAADSVFSKAVKWITDVQVAADGTLTVTYNNDDDPYVASQKLKWINDITLSDRGTLTISYNNGSENTVFTDKVRWLTGATLASNGTFTLTWNNETSTVYANMMKWISGVSVATDGTVTFTWNNGENPYSINQLMKWISNASINTAATGSTDEGSGNQKVVIQWNDGTSQEIGAPINYVMNMAVNGDNHLLVRYSDPQRRINGVTYDSVSGWTDLGKISQQYEYDAGDSASNLYWNGFGRILDSGTGTQVIDFNVSPVSYINPAINTITATAGTLVCNSKSISINMDETNTTITKSLTGFHFHVNTTIPTTQQVTSEYVNLEITDMTLNFSVISPQP